MRALHTSLALGTLLGACHHAPATRIDPPAERVALLACDSVRPPPPPAQRRTPGALTAAERDSIIREAQARRAAWRARGITDYRLRVAVGCFCPWPGNPAVIDVRNGVIVALRDTTGKSAGRVREPWSIYTVEGLFDGVEEGARRNDVLEVRYDACFDYPTMIRGDARLGYPDDWFSVTADHLTPRR